MAYWRCGTIRRSSAGALLALGLGLIGCGGNAGESDRGNTRAAESGEAPALTPAPKAPKRGTLEFIAAQARKAGLTARPDPQPDGRTDLIVQSRDIVAHAVFYDSTAEALPEGGEFSRLSRGAGKGKTHFVIVGPPLAEAGAARLWWTSEQHKVDGDDFLLLVSRAEGCADAPTAAAADCNIVVSDVPGATR